MSYANSLGDASCTCRLFGGGAVAPSGHAIRQAAEQRRPRHARAVQDWLGRIARRHLPGNAHSDRRHRRPVRPPPRLLALARVAVPCSLEPAGRRHARRAERLRRRIANPGPTAPASEISVYVNSSIFNEASIPPITYGVIAVSRSATAQHCRRGDAANDHAPPISMTPVDTLPEDRGFRRPTTHRGEERPGRAGRTARGAALFRRRSREVQEGL